LIGAATDSTGLESWGVPGQSNWVTVYTNPDHAHIVIDGFNFDTAAGEGMPPNPPASGPRWTTNLTDAGTFQPRTWSGLCQARAASGWSWRWRLSCPSRSGPPR